MKRMLSCFLLSMLLCVCSCPIKANETLGAKKLQPSNAISKQSIAQANQPVWWEEAFHLNDKAKEKIRSAKLYRYSDQVSLSVITALGPDQTNKPPYYDFSYLDDLSPADWDDIGKPLSDLSMLEIVLDSDIKYTYRLYERGVIVSKLAPGQGGEAVSGEYGQNKPLTVDLEAYHTLLSSLRANLKEKRCYGATWLDLMRQTNAERMIVTSADKKQSSEYNRQSLDRFLQAFSTIQGMDVEPKSCRHVPLKTKLNNAAHIQIDFYNGIRYDVMHNGKSLLIASSDMDYALVYKSEESYYVEELDDMADGRLPILCYKPVIYLYPQKPMDVSVKVHYKGNFSYTYPTYHDGWNVTAYPDGKLINKADSREHYYLFWEGDAAADWKFDEGFVVKGCEAEQFLIDKLSYMGLTPREYNDFIVFWLPYLQQNTYNLITFSADQYEELAPLEISPKPDGMLRVHMVFKKLSQPVKIKPQTLKPFERKGFTVVEWGGSRA